ncbi:MAG: RDD family protein [Dehalococcoidia bacterium]
MAATSAGITCPHCNARTQQALFCQVCGLFMADRTGTLQRVTYNRRFFGDSLLEGVLVLVTLVVGWLIWLAFTAQTSQTPAKRILGVYVLDAATGVPVSAGKMWVREVLVKWLLVTLINAVIGVGGLIDALWVFFDKDRQTLHDKVASTVVVYAPAGLPEEFALATPQPIARQVTPPMKDVAEQLRELARLHEQGILTDEEYEQKRSELAGKL